ncbi:MAG: ATP-binding protein [Acidobacteria bacterium]|nr:MAG: ATP-binding protein [Acidobacteriota bacterium]
MTQLERTPSFGEYRPILERLLTASGLQDFVELSGFLKSLRFHFNQPDRDTMTERVRSRLVRLGIDQAQYAALLDAVVNWSISGQKVEKGDVLRVLGLLDRFVDRLTHYFPVDQKVWVPTPEIFESLDSAIKTVESGFILLEGEPGSGKSTALTMYLLKRSDIRFGYYCFVPDDRSIGNERLGDDAFVRSICIGLMNAFPDVEFPRRFAAHTVSLLNDWLSRLSALGRRVIFVVDGLDHVDRKSRQSLIANPLTHVLDGELPKNVVIILSSRYPEALPAPLLKHIREEPKRHLKMRRFGYDQVREFFQLRGVSISDELLPRTVDVSGGVPIYLEYLADRLGGMTRYEQERYLESAPIIRDRKIDHYHEHLWEESSKDEHQLYILAILAARDEFTTPDALREILRLVGVHLTLAALTDALSHLRHVLRVSDARAVAIRHSSLAEFVLERTQHLRDEITQAILDWYSQHPDTDEAWRHQFRHLFKARAYSTILTTCTDAWLARAWVDHRPMAEINRNLDIAWQAASTNLDIQEFVRIALLKQRIALVSRNLDLSEADVACLLLDMGEPDESLRRVWDGERRQCSPVEFAAFCLDHSARLGRVPPDHILRAGIGDGLSRGASPDAARVWYRARSYVEDPVDSLLSIQHIVWRTEDDHHLLSARLTDDENRRLNLEIQLEVVREIAERASLDVLERIRVSPSLSPELRTAAQAAAALVLARAG